MKKNLTHNRCVKKIIFPICALTCLTVGLHAHNHIRAHAGDFGDRAFDQESKIYTSTYYSDPYYIDQVYMSMQGPYQLQHIRIGEDDGLQWITRFAMDNVDLDHQPIERQEHLCHGQLNYRSKGQYAENNTDLFTEKRTLPSKWFTTIQGAADIDLPEGFGIPFYSKEPLRLMSMALNQQPDIEPFSTKIRTQIEHIPDAELDQPLKALGKFAVDVRIPIYDDGTSAADHAGCAVGEEDIVVHAADGVEGQIDLTHTQGGMKTTPHFYVPPGKFTYIQDFSGASVVPYNTTLHYISAHLHRYGTVIELWDTTTDTLLFQSVPRMNADGTYISRMPDYSSSEGIEIRTDHDYQIRAKYNNTTEAPIDAMAVMYFYFHDLTFRV